MWEKAANWMMKAWKINRETDRIDEAAKIEIEPGARWRRPMTAGKSGGNREIEIQKEGQ